MARYFRLSDGRKVTADNDGAVRELIKWGVDNKIGVSEYFIYQDPQNKQYEVDAWARERALQHPALKGAVNVGEMGPRTAPDLNKPAQEPQKKQLQQSEPTTNVDLRNVRNTSKAVEYQHPGGGFQEFYSQVQSGKVTAPQVKNIDPAKYTEEQLNKNITEPRLREAYQSWQNRRTETPYQPNSQTRLDKAVSERERIGRDIENLVLARPPDSETELLKNWKISYEGEVDKYNFYTEQIIPYRATGLNAAQRELADSAAKWADKYPALAATVGQLGMGLWGLATSPYNLITAGMGRDNEAYYALRQGISQGLAGEGLWNDVGSGFYSFGLVAPLAIGTALSGGTASPLLAKALGVAGTATMQMSITSDIMRELYQDDNYLSFMEAGAAAVSGAAQQLTENLSLSFQTKALSNAFKLGGQAGLRQATSELVRKAFAPTLGEQAVGLLQTFGTEILEENLQWAEDAVIQNVMLGKPMPTWEETKQAVRDNTIGALFGVVLQSGAMMGVQARQSRTSAQALKALAADESGWTSPKLAQQAIDQLTAGQIGEAAETAQKAHQALISSDAAMDEKAKRHVLKAVGSVYGAANMYDAQTAANVFIEEKAAKKELAALEQEKRKLEKAIPSQQTEDKLFLLNEKIEEADAELVRLQGVITENAHQKEIYNILNEASEAEQKARKAGDKALDKLTDSKAYNEATPEQQRQMMKDAVLSDKKSAKLQEKADQKYREANLYKLRQTPAYKQAAPEVQTQMEEAELQRQQEARDAEFEAARQKAISEQQEAEKAAETASNEATEEIEVIPDIIDQLEAKKAAIRQERQDINKELTEYRKLMDQQGGWLPSVTPEQKKAYHEVKQRQKEVNRKLNEVGIEIRKEKAAQKKAAAEQQKPKKKAKPKEKKKTEKPQETEAKEQPKKSKKAEAKETEKKEKPETKKEAPQKEKEAESEPEKAPKKALKKDAEPETKTELPAIEPYTPSARMRGGDKLRTEKFYRLYKLEKLRDAGVKKVMLGSATVGIETAIKRTQNSLGATSQSEYWEWKKKRDTLIDADKIAVAEGKVIPDEVLKDYPELQTPETDTRTKSEALQETLPTIPDKTADDALLGMVKSHILSITRKDRTTTVNFKDGRQLVINHITQEAMLTEAGKTGVMYAGRTQGEKGKNVYKAIVDLVDGLNQGNRTLFHESFHVVWKLFLNSEQISYIKQYYRAKANKGELVRKYVVTRQGTEMALYWTKEQFNALNRERQAEALEEGAAYGFEHWLGSRTDTAPTTMIGKLWQRLADAIRHALVKLNLASQNAKLNDIFHAVASDKLTGQGEQGADNRTKPYVGYSWSVNAQKAKDAGMLTKTELKQKYKYTDAEIELAGADEWHHTSNHYNKTNFYDPDAFKQRLMDAIDSMGFSSLADYRMALKSVPKMVSALAKKHPDIPEPYIKTYYNRLILDNNIFKRRFIEKGGTADGWAYKEVVSLIFGDSYVLNSKVPPRGEEWTAEHEKRENIVNKLLEATGNQTYALNNADQIQVKDHARYKQIEEKNLVTIHNIPVDSIEKVNSRGGLVMPSIAIIDATKTRFDGFGDASLLTGDELVNVSAKNPLYTSDAYTPTYPKIYQIVKHDSQLNTLAEYLTKKTGKKVSVWDLDANIEDQGAVQYITSLLYGKLDYRKAQTEAARTLEKYPINIEEKIFAGWTQNGRKRLVPHTAENVIKVMKKESREAPATFWGTSSLRGALAPKFSSLAQAKKNRDMLLSKEEMESIEKETDELFIRVSDKAKPFRKNVGFIHHFDIASDIYDMSRRGWGDIASLYTNDSVRNDFQKVIDHMKSLPTQYFEYKPQRIVGLNEFVGAVVPTGTKASTQKALRDAGIKVYKYKAGDSESRFEVTKKASEELGIRYKSVPTAAEVAEAERQYAEVEAKYRGTAGWLKAPNGKPTNLNERQWVQVRTPAFKAWFGDWENDPANASKVVDENGEPMVVWHGSMEYGFNEFHNGRRHYFTDNGIVAEEYSGYYEDKIYDVFLNLRNPVIADAGGMRYTDIIFGKAEREADENGHDGAIISNVDDAKYLLKGSTAKIGTTYIATSKTQIKSATANVGTFSENPDIRYRKLTERERAMRDDVWNEIMGRPPTLRAQTRPKVQTEPPEKEPERKDEPQRPQPARPSQSKPPTEAEIDVLSERIGKDLGIAPAQVKEKLGRQMMAAWREAQGDISRLMESAAIRNFEEWVENNKPEGTDSRDLTWHWEEMLEYAAKVGLSREQIAQMVKSDRFDATAIGINLFQRMNYVGKLLVETEATLADRNWGTPAEREQKEAQYGILQAQFDELQAAYAMQGSEAGTVLWTRRQNKAQYLENLTRAAQALESKINRGSLELAEMRQELDGLERAISDLEKSFEMLLRVMDGKRYKDITEMSNAELEAERQKQAERLNDLRNRAERLRYEIDQKVAAMQADKGRQEETQTQIRKIRKTGRKAKVIEIKERKPDVHDWIRAAWYNSVLAGIPTHMVNMSANVVNSLLEDVITLFAQGGKVAGAQFAEKFRALFSNYEQLDPKTGEKIKTGAFAKAKEEFTDPQEFSKKNEVILKGNKLFMGIQFSTKFLGAEDMLAFFPNERGMLKSLAFDESKRTGRSVADLMENPTSDMLRQAYYEAKRNTFNQNPEGYVGVLIEAINKFYNALDQSGGGGKAIGNLIRFNVMPFTRVLGNVLNATIDYTPLGMIRYFAYKSDNPNSLLNRQRKDQNGRPLWLDENGDRMVSPFKARDARRQAARVALGTILGSLLYFLTMSADDDDEDKWFISGAGPQDYKKYKQLMAAGWRPFSFHIGNVIISYKEWPVSGAFAVIGNLHDIQKYDGKTRPQDWLDKTIYATMGVASSFLDRSFASNAISTATALDRGDPKWVKRSLTSTTSSTIIPYNNMLRFIENTYNRDLYTPETIAQQAWASVPLVPKKGLPRRVNVFGMYEKKDPATARLAMTDNVGLVVPDTKKTREIFQTVRKNNLFLSETTKREHRVDPYVGKRGIPEEDKQYIWLQGKDHENFRVMRGTEYVRLLNEPQNYNLIMQYDKNKDKDELAALLTSLGRKATAYATEETLKAYQRGELKHKYNTYNKSREEED